MANICSNNLIIKGNRKRIEEFDTQFKSKFLLITGGTTSYTNIEHDYKFHRIISKTSPKGETYTSLTYILGEEYAERYSLNNFIPITREDFLNGWSDWGKVNWGISKDIYDVYVSGIDNPGKEIVVYYSFSSNWAEPNLAVNEMAKQYPELEFRHEFVEEAMDYAGFNEYENGEIIESIYNFDTKEDYRTFTKKHFEYEYYICKKCEALLEEWEIDNEGGQCPECEGKEFYDINNQLIEDWFASGHKL